MPRDNYETSSINLTPEFLDAIKPLPVGVVRFAYRAPEPQVIGQGGRGYDFVCDPCKAAYELRMTPATYTADQQCPACGGQLRRVWGTPPIHYKGLGFSPERGGGS